MISRNILLTLVVVFMTSQLELVTSHGRLWNPVARSSAWRKGFNTPANYNDNQLFCGGLSVQKSNGYKCGVCGDAYNQADKPHEAGGKYATGTIVATYKQGQKVNLEVQITANHMGWFEFKICPVNDKNKKATHECLDKHVLQLSDGSGTKLNVAGLGNAMVTIPVDLPKDLTCDQCVIQWHYHCGNNWGTDEDGKSCIGCGYTNQEEFYGCADVKIEPSSGSPNSGSDPATNPPADPTDAAAQATEATKPPAEATRSSDIFGLTSRSTKMPDTMPPHPDKPDYMTSMDPHQMMHCVPVQDIPGMEQWCYVHCKQGNCPPSHCRCEPNDNEPTV